MTMLQPALFALFNIFATWRFFAQDRHHLGVFFALCSALLIFFSALIAWMRKKQIKSAQELMARTLTFWLIITLFALAFMAHPVVIFAIFIATTLLAQWEYISLPPNSPQTLAEIAKSKQSALLSLGALAGYGVLYYGSLESFLAFGILYAAIAIPCVCVVWNEKDFAQLATGHLFFSLLLPTAWPLFKTDPNAFLLIIFLTEIRDLVSYWLGKGLSKIKPRSPKVRALLEAKVAEQVSPNKTWIVGLATTVIVIILGGAMARHVFPLDFSAGPVFWAFLQIGILGLFGDLVFSLIKRNHGRKDSGAWMPGGSGLLDRIDALVFTIPAGYFCLAYL